MISAVVVTFNKLELLKECIEAIKKQSILPDRIIIVDNNSTDGTKEFLIEEATNDQLIVPLLLEENIGGAGGFNRGIKKAMEYRSDFVWVMDDDTIPSVTALENLIKAKNEIGKDNFSFLASNVRWIDGKACLMNVPRVLQDWNNTNFVELEFSSFVSMFINAECIKEVGYPISDFFIWGDDVEYAKRLRQSAPGYYVFDSIVIHKMAQNTRTDILVDSAQRIPRYFYSMRNVTYIARKDGKKEFMKHFLNKYLWINLKICFSKTDHKLKKLGIWNKGFWKGLFFNPVVEKYEE